MVIRNVQKALLFFLPVLWFVATSHAEVNEAEKHILVSMRMIGHTILLHSGDSVSQVLPVEKVEGRYKIRFASDYQFNPDKLVTIVDSVVKSTNIASRYITEVEKCETGEVVYSFEVGNPEHSDVIPCRTRMLDKACYSIFLTILEADSPDLAAQIPSDKYQVNDINPVWLISIPFALIGLIVFTRKKTQTPRVKSVDPNLVAMGDYQFNLTNSELLWADQRIELSAKESDLLLLLYRFVNTTVEREVLLRNIWGDEGDYVGRTLDVFVSKLRKKLEADDRVKIVNVRGVGYKMVIEERG